MQVSIVIPAYNRESLLPRTLDSVAALSWRPLEVIVVDDGSSDQTLAVARRFAGESAQTDFRVHALGQANAGSAAARNRGIEAATGEAILFLDSDDTLSPKGLAALAESLQAWPEIDFCYGRVAVVNPQGGVIASEIGQPRGDLRGAVMTYDWHTMGALYRRTFLERVAGWEPGINGSDDWILQAKAKLIGRGQFVDTLVGSWVQHVGDRMGATVFRASYTADVTRACLAIAEYARGVDAFSQPLQRALAARCLRHVWELGRFGAKAERRDAFQRACQIAQGDLRSTVIVRIGAALGCIDGPLHAFVDRRRFMAT